MRPPWILFLPLLVAGCATRPPVAVAPPPPVASVAVFAPTRLVETPYAVRSYRAAVEPDIRHEAHVIYRRTRVPLAAEATFATVPRASAPALAAAPLPASAELAAELATQKTVTTELRALQAALVEAERQLQAQYAALVRQSAEVVKVRQQLEAERRRPPEPALGPATAAAPAKSSGGDTAPEVKW